MCVLAREWNFIQDAWNKQCKKRKEKNLKIELWLTVLFFPSYIFWQILCVCWTQNFIEIIFTFFQLLNINNYYYNILKINSLYTVVISVFYITVVVMYGPWNFPLWPIRKILICIWKCWDIETMVKKQFQGILAIITLGNESTRIFIVISFILLKKLILSDLKLYEVIQMRLILLLPLLLPPGQVYNVFIFG